jgi:hypothetical protein
MTCKYAFINPYLCLAQWAAGRPAAVVDSTFQTIPSQQPHSFNITFPFPQFTNSFHNTIPSTFQPQTKAFHLNLHHFTGKSIPLPWQRPVARSIYNSRFFPMHAHRLARRSLSLSLSSYTCTLAITSNFCRAGAGAPPREKVYFLTLRRTWRPIGFIVNVRATRRCL